MFAAFVAGVRRVLNSMTMAIREALRPAPIATGRAAKGLGIRVLKTAIRAPLMNATCERFVGSVRRECLDHVIILGEAHLRTVLSEYVAHFNASRPTRGSSNTFRFRRRLFSPVPADLSWRLPCSEGSITTTDGRLEVTDDSSSQHKPAQQAIPSDHFDLSEHGIQIRASAQQLSYAF